MHKNRVIIDSAMVMPFDRRGAYERLLRSMYEMTNGYPEQGGGGSSAALSHAPANGLFAAEADAADCDAAGGEGAPAVASDDDDDGDGDGDPDSDRRRPRSKKSTPSFPPALLGFAPLSHYVGFNRSRIYALIGAGQFPRPIKVGKSSRWIKTEIDTWITRQSQQRTEV